MKDRHGNTRCDHCGALRAVGWYGDPPREPWLLQRAAGRSLALCGICVAQARALLEAVPA